ncbi:hypothetical protein AB0L34_04410 [Micromonospora sp. NPDC052213]|uniref:hypothetical protein n=1 Tax=Micromonospora sp. NPDC052213 TaxID=3155812 RepID=UPI003435742C
MEALVGVELPVFYSYYESPVKFVRTADGRVAAWRLSKDTGGWLSADHLMETILLVGGDEIEELTREEFIQLAEHDRGYCLRGEGAVFALYETIRAIQHALASERRHPSPAESALIAGIQRRTFVMFEEELQRAGDPAADPLLAQ